MFQIWTQGLHFQSAWTEPQGSEHPFAPDKNKPKSLQKQSFRELGMQSMKSERSLKRWEPFLRREERFCFCPQRSGGRRNPRTPGGGHAGGGWQGSVRMNTTDRNPGSLRQSASPPPQCFTKCSGVECQGQGQNCIAMPLRCTGPSPSARWGNACWSLGLAGESWGQPPYTQQDITEGQKKGCGRWDWGRKLLRHICPRCRAICRRHRAGHQDRGFLECKCWRQD